MSPEDQEEYRAHRQANKRKKVKETRDRLKTLEIENNEMKKHLGRRSLILNLCFVT